MNISIYGYISAHMFYIYITDIHRNNDPRIKCFPSSREKFY